MSGERNAAKFARRAERELAMAEAIATANGLLADIAPLYGVILADPPWRFAPWSRKTGMDRAADNHYPTMHTREISALRVPAAKDCVLFLWATTPMLCDALAVMTAWEFGYKSHWCWAKDRVGTGYWGRCQHELLLIGTKGRVPAPAPGTQPSSLITAPVGRHSEKPALFASLIAGLFPHVPKLEMFARSARPGWDAWGPEAG
jgi:N6-adenosine-specific RNA methylase IME4